MTTPEALNALADRVEREEPSRELDAAIAQMASIAHRSRRTARGVNKGREWLVDSHGRVEEWRHAPPSYTTSLDAAVTLVPEQWTAWELRSHQAKTRFSADLSRLTECDAGEDWAHGRGATPAAALTAAALRARAALAVKDSEGDAPATSHATARGP